jgi:hydroxymethylbilane synthase
VNRLRLGTRGSELALWQANAVAAGVRRRSGRECELVVITTTGDRLHEANLSLVGGKRVFVKEIEQALIRGDIDLAVHSAKDMPAELSDGLAIAAVLPRADPRDAVVQPAGAARLPELSAAGNDADGGPAPRVGSGSVRRVAQLRRAWPRAQFRLVRGNVGTRLRKLDAGDCDLLVLAVAGLERLGLAHRISMPLDPDVCLPAPGQGIVAVETRPGDADTGTALAAIDDRAARAAFTAERAVVTALGGGCQMPIGALAEGDGDRLRLRAMVASLDGSRRLCREAAMPADAALALGAAVARDLLADGAGPILEAAQRAAAGDDANTAR